MFERLLICLKDALSVWRTAVCAGELSRQSQETGVLAKALLQCMCQVLKDEQSTKSHLVVAKNEM